MAIRRYLNWELASRTARIMDPIASTALVALGTEHTLMSRSESKVRAGIKWRENRCQGRHKALKSDRISYSSSQYHLLDMLMKGMPGGWIPDHHIMQPRVISMKASKIPCWKLTGQM